MSISTQMRTEVSQLYVALFGRAPDAQGLNYWAGLLDTGQNMTQVANTMFGTTPARTYFPDGLSNGQLIASFYLNVLGRTADANGLAYWTAKLDAPGATPGSVITEMIDVIATYTGAHPAGVTSAALFNNRSEAALFYGENGGSIGNAAAVLSGVTAQDQTVLEARVFTKAYASGELDAGGFAEIHLGSLLGNVALTNVTDGAALRLDQGSSSYTIDVQLLDPSGSDDSLLVYLPSSATYNFTRFELDGFEHVELVSQSTQGWFGEDVRLGSAHLKSVVVTGRGVFGLIEANADLIDGSAFTDDFMAPTNGVTRIIGTTGADGFHAFGAGGRLEGGAGNDQLSGKGPITLVGGAGQDGFTAVRSTTSKSNYISIGDFEKGSDSLYLYDLVTNYAFSSPTVASNYGTWYPQQVSLSTGATFNDYLDAAAAPRLPWHLYASLNWFRFGGDSYVVIDNSYESGFQDGTDQIVKFVGLTDLSTLKYDTSWATMG